MIGKIDGEITLSCDICGEEVGGFDEFYEAVEYKKDEGWKSQRRNGEWEDVCPECQKAR